MLDGATEADLSLNNNRTPPKQCGTWRVSPAGYAGRLGLTQVEFARRIDVPHETIRNWEQGKRRPRAPPRLCCGFLTRRLKRLYGC